MPEHRCRLCTANDRDAVIEHIAKSLWESRDERPWDDAGGYWRTIMRELAATAAESLKPASP